MSGEVRRPVEGSALAVLSILILCFGLGMFIHVLADKICLSPKPKGDQSQMGKGSISINADRFESENIRNVVTIINTYNKDMHPQLKWDIACEINRMTMRHLNLDIDLLCSVITYGSRKTWSPAIFSSQGALGLMQIRPAIGKFFAPYEGIEWTTDGEILLNPIWNIRIGARYLSTLIGRYGLENGLAVYLMDQRSGRWSDKMDDCFHERRLRNPTKV